jgi:ADP-ribose pyrophosphatase
VQPEASREAFRGSLIRVEVEDWPAGEREIVRHPGACAVVAVTPGGEVLLVRQFREAVGHELLEIPAGILDVDGEEAQECAARELLEETGYRATKMERLCSIYTSPGFTDERIELFLAETEESPVAGHTPEAGLDVVRVPIESVVSTSLEGDILDAKSLIGVLLARERAES